MRIFGEHLDFDLITRSLGVQPSNAHRVGEPDLIGHPFTHDLWSIDAPADRTETLDKHLLALRQVLEPRYDFLRSLKGQAQVRSFCGIISDGHKCAFRLSPEALRIFTRLDIDMELSLIFLCLDTEQASLETVPNPCSIEESGSETQTYRTESRVSLHVTGAASDLKKATKVLSLPVSDNPHPADPSPLRRMQRGNYWTLTSPLAPTDELDSHMKWLAGILLANSKLFHPLKPRAEMLIHCNFGTESDTGGADISPEGLQACTEIGIPLEVNAFLI